MKKLIILWKFFLVCSYYNQLKILKRYTFDLVACFIHEFLHIIVCLIFLICKRFHVGDLIQFTDDGNTLISYQMYVESSTLRTSLWDNIGIFLCSIAPLLGFLLPLLHPAFWILILISGQSFIPSAQDTTEAIYGLEAIKTWFEPGTQEEKAEKLSIIHNILQSITHEYIP